MRWFRVHASRIATTAILTLAVLGVSAAVPHQDDCHDLACQPLVVEHDASAHRFTSPETPADHALHCLVCHWARAFRPRTEARLLTAPASGAGITFHIEYFTAAPNTPAAQPPLRSPPSSLDLA
jgi:hypothetical protein